MKLTNIVRYACATLLAVNFLTACSSSKDTLVNKPGMFYAITGNGLKDTSWLFGTYHLVRSSYLDSLPAVKAAFNKSNGVVVEIVMSEIDTTALQAMMVMPNNTLTSLLDKGFADSLNTELKTKTGVGIEQYNHYKPMQVALTLTVADMQYNNQQLQQLTGLPLDLYFAEQGKNNGKQVIPLETVQSQVDLLMNTLSETQQVATLQYMIRNKEQVSISTNKLSSYWFKQEFDSLWSLMNDTSIVNSTGGSHLFYLLNDDRNNKWMKKLPAMLTQQSQFIAVGALHLVGPSGLVNQLRKLGYTVTPIK